jgi:REP element-mobilizing transposase RayT
MINKNISKKLKEIFTEIGEKYGITLMEWGGEDDHVHCLFKDRPQTHYCLSKIYKYITSLFTISGTPIEMIQK